MAEQEVPRAPRLVFRDAIGSDRSDNAAHPNSFPSDEDLLRRVLQNDAAAFTLLFSRHQGGLYRFLRGLAGDDLLAEDLLQETFLRLWRAPGALSSVRKGRAYIYRIAVNLLRDHSRRMRRELALPPHTLGPGSSEPPTADALGERDALARAFKALSEPQQVVLALHYHADQSIPDVARVLGIPEGTVKTRLARAYRRLANALREEDEHAGRP